MNLVADQQEKKIAEPDRPIHPLLRQRWSPRMFSPKAVSREDLKTLLEAARWAPSSMNQQPWRFIYTFRGSRSYERIFSCLSEFNQKWTKNAPVLLLTAYQEKFDSGKENFHALHDLGLAVGNLCLQATQMDIAVHQMAGVDWEKAQSVFDVPEGYHVATAVAIGYHGGDADELPDDLEKQEEKARERMPVEAFAWEGRWAEHD